MTIAITKPSGGLDTIAPVERLTPLPQAKQPLLIELGVLKGGSEVLFVVAPGTILSGPAKCLPGRIDCQIISLAPNQIESLYVKGATGPTHVSDFAVTGITTTSHKSAADAGRVRRQVSKTGPEAAAVFALRRALAVPVRAERRRDRRSTQPDSRGKLMRRMMLIAFTFVVISLLGAASAGAVVIDMGASGRYGVALVPGTRSTLTTAGITTVTAGAPCTDPWLASDFILQSSRPLLQRRPGHARQRDVRGHLGSASARLADDTELRRAVPQGRRRRQRCAEQLSDAVLAVRAHQPVPRRRRPRPLHALRTAAAASTSVSPAGPRASLRARSPPAPVTTTSAATARSAAPTTSGRTRAAPGAERQRVLHHRRPDPHRGLADGQRHGADRTHPDRLHAADRAADAARRRRLPRQRRQDLLGERRLHRPVLLLPRAGERRRHAWCRYVVQPWTAQTRAATTPAFPRGTTTCPRSSIAIEAAERLVSPLSQGQLAAITDPALNGWYALDGSEMNDNGCVGFPKSLDQVTVGASGQNPYCLQREFNNAGAIVSDPNAPKCAPLVDLAPTFVVPSPIDAGDVVAFDGSVTELDAAHPAGQLPVELRRWHQPRPARASSTSSPRAASTRSR